MQHLFLSLLSSQHPLALYQLLETCARSNQQLSPKDIYTVCQIALRSSSRLGTKGLIKLLTDPAVVSSLASAVCSALKQVLVQTASVPPASTSAEEPVSATGQQGANCSSSSSSSSRRRAGHRPR
jgi:hypothetical protein